MKLKINCTLSIIQGQEVWARQYVNDEVGAEIMDWARADGPNTWKRISKQFELGTWNVFLDDWVLVDKDHTVIGVLDTQQFLSFAKTFCESHE